VLIDEFPLRHFAVVRVKLGALGEFRAVARLHEQRPSRRPLGRLPAALRHRPTVVDPDHVEAGARAQLGVVLRGTLGVSACVWLSFSRSSIPLIAA